MNIGELCTRSVVITTAEASVREAAQLMRKAHVGDLVVIEREDGTAAPIGIVTDRDLVIEVTAVGADPDTTRVEEVMTAELVTSREDEDPAAVLRRMRNFGVRRMPIVDRAGALIGIITHDDLVEWLAEQLGDLLGVVRVEQDRERARM